MDVLLDNNLAVLAGAVLVLTGYCALQFIERIPLRPGDRLLWILGAGLTLGTGSFAAHQLVFAWSPPEPEIIHDLPLTLFSWLAAVTVSTLAVNLLPRTRPGITRILTASLVFGLVICVTHFSSITALRLMPGAEHSAGYVLFAAIAGSAGFSAAMLLVFHLPLSSRQARAGLRLSAAMVLTLATISAHGLLMSAMSLRPDTISLTLFGVSGQWQIWPLVLAGIVLSAVVLVLARRSPHGEPPEAITEHSGDNRGETARLLENHGIGGRAALNRTLREAESGHHQLAVVILKLVRIRPAGGDRSRGTTPHRLLTLARRLQSARPELHISWLDDDKLAVAAFGRGAEQLIAELERALPWQHFCEEQAVDLRLGHVEYPAECGTMCQIVPRAAACLQPWPRFARQTATPRDIREQFGH